MVNVDCDIYYLVCSFRDAPQLHQAKAGIAPQIMVRLLSFLFLPIHLPSFDSRPTYSDLLRTPAMSTICRTFLNHVSCKLSQETKQGTETELKSKGESDFSVRASH
jgi:hypothetical protein